MFKAVKQFFLRLFGKAEEQAPVQPGSGKRLTKAEQKEIEAVIAANKRNDRKELSAQDSIPFQRMFPDGICRVTDTLYTKQDLAVMQAWPLARKIQETQAKIREWYEHYGGRVFVSFGGGKDSTILLDLVRGLYPDVPAAYADTGLEYPEIQKFVRSVPNVEWLQPVMPFTQIIKQYGYPVISKDVAKRIYYARKGSNWAINYLNGLNSDGSPSWFCQRYQRFITNPKIKKIDSEYEKNAAKITELQARQRELEEQRTKLRRTNSLSWSRAGAVNTACEIYAVNIGECAGKERSPEAPEEPAEPDTPPEPEKKGGSGPLLIVLVLAVSSLARLRPFPRATSALAANAGARAKTKDTDRLMAMLSFQSLSFSTLEGRKGDVRPHHQGRESFSEAGSAETFCTEKAARKI